MSDSTRAPSTRDRAFGFEIGVVTEPITFFTGLQCMVKWVTPATNPGAGKNVADGDLFSKTAGGVAGNDGAPDGIGTLSAT